MFFVFFTAKQLLYYHAKRILSTLFYFSCPCRRKDGCPIFAVLYIIYIHTRTQGTRYWKKDFFEIFLFFLQKQRRRDGLPVLRQTESHAEGKCRFSLFTLPCKRHFWAYFPADLQSFLPFIIYIVNAHGFPQGNTSLLPHRQSRSGSDKSRRNYTKSNNIHI